MQCRVKLVQTSRGSSKPIKNDSSRLKAKHKKSDDVIFLKSFLFSKKFLTDYFFLYPCLELFIKFQK